jgi:RNA polymerase sigma-70 factor (ECF subfamily)
MEPDERPVGVSGVDGLATYPATPTPTATPSPAPAALPVAADLIAAGGLEFSDFYRRSRDSVARALAVTIGDVHLAAEAADEAMARAYQRWPKVRSFDNPAGWVYRVGLNWATSVLRRHRNRPEPWAERGAPDVGPITEPDVLAALSELDVRQRAVVVCRFYLGLSEAETAAALGTRPGTVKSRLHRALRHLQVRLDHLRPEELQ